MNGADEWRVYQLNDCEWWVARSLEEAIKDWMLQTGCGRDELDDPQELGEAALDSLQFVSNPEDREEDWERCSFREELKRHASAPDAKPGLFASTEY